MYRPTHSSPRGLAVAVPGAVILLLLIVLILSARNSRSNAQEGETGQPQTQVSDELGEQELPADNIGTVDVEVPSTPPSYLPPEGASMVEAGPALTMDVEVITTLPVESGNVEELKQVVARFETAYYSHPTADTVTSRRARLREFMSEEFVDSLNLSALFDSAAAQIFDEPGTYVLAFVDPQAVNIEFLNDTAVMATSPIRTVLYQDDSPSNETQSVSESRWVLVDGHGWLLDGYDP